MVSLPRFKYMHALSDMRVGGIDVGTKNFAFVCLEFDEKKRNESPVLVDASLTDFGEGSISEIITRFHSKFCHVRIDALCVEQQSPIAHRNFALAHALVGWAVSRGVRVCFGTARTKFDYFGRLLDVPVSMSYAQRKAYAVSLMQVLCETYGLDLSEFDNKKQDDIADALIYALNYAIELRVISKPGVVCWDI